MRKKVFLSLLVILFFGIIIDSVIKISHKNDLNNIASYFEYYSTFFLGCFFVIVAFYCYLQKQNSQVVHNFFYLMYVTGLAISLSKPSSMELSFPRNLEILSVSFAPYFLMKFFTCFPVSAKPKFFYKITSATFWLALIINVINIYKIIRPHHFYADIIRIAAILNIMVAVIGSIILIIFHLRSNTLWIRNQLYILIFSIVVSFVPVIFLSLILGEIFDHYSIPYYYSLHSMIVFPITMAYLLTKQEIIDFSASFKKHIFPIISIGLTLIFINVIISIVFTLNFNQLALVNICVLSSLLTYILIQKLLEPYKRNRWKLKTGAIQHEKKIIFQQLLDGKHLTVCAKHIIGLLEKVIGINDACIIWKRERPIVLYQSGSFNNRQECDRIIDTIIIRKKELGEIIKDDPYYILPLKGREDVLGWMVVGKKKNYTIIDKEEWLLLEKIQEDAVELFSNAQALHQFEKKLRKAQQESDMFNHFNTILLHDLEEEQRKLSIFLHDEVLQSLIFVKNKLEKDYPELDSCLKNVIYNVREMCNHLHPVMVEDLGLEPSLQALKKQLQLNHNVEIELDYQLHLIILPKELSINMFRMIKELIHNAIKHASPFKIKVSLTESEGVITIRVEDDGKGFEIANPESVIGKNGIGLATVQKRVDLLSGTIDIRSKKDIGTFITITLPFEGSDLIEDKGAIS
ncbi:histidine kinase [Caldibacillus thermoamylovorans]|uniref:sensor histidine kinase n=1 Tax=Caldibacillus thermoamylovorans TaxID=35841 RepID=UPI001D06938B|nr:ATP-binding protein [Caldibacillus thermoamylovorans]MCB5935763.1 histidine kinase [Bacillus sp. DFI.2.34]MCB7077238.1 histidine kinase [Caldibacillus thermoamylovorans]